VRKLGGIAPPVETARGLLAVAAVVPLSREKMGDAAGRNVTPTIVDPRSMTGGRGAATGGCGWLGAAGETAVRKETAGRSAGCGLTVDFG
jgi:hypothetical protein